LWAFRTKEWKYLLNSNRVLDHNWILNDERLLQTLLFLDEKPEFGGVEGFHVRHHVLQELVELLFLEFPVLETHVPCFLFDYGVSFVHFLQHSR
jgi:hypothetical protein